MHHMKSQKLNEKKKVTSENLSFTMQNRKIKNFTSKLQNIFKNKPIR